jgi:hypothetical protein
MTYRPMPHESSSFAGGFTGASPVYTGALSPFVASKPMLGNCLALPLVAARGACDPP